MSFLEYFKNFFRCIAKILKIAKLNYKIYKITKNKNNTLKELGIVVYEFYNVDKRLLEEEEVESLISEIKDYEIEIDALENEIEKLKNSNVKEKNEISNELLFNIKDEVKQDEREDNQSGKSS